MTRRTIASLPEDSRGIVRLVRGLAVGLIVALLILGAAVVGTYLRGESTRSIVTKVSECEQNAASAACQQIRKEGAEAQSQAVACITIRQGGYPCPRPGSTPSQLQVSPDFGIRNGGDASTGSNPQSQPGPQKGGQADNPVHVPPNDAPPHEDEAPQPVDSGAPDQLPPPPPVSESANDNGVVSGVLEEAGHVVDNLACTIAPLGVRYCP